MSESAFQTEIKHFLEDRFKEIIIMKSNPQIIQGFPDLIILYKDKYALLEVKDSDKATQQPNQQWYIDTLGQYTYTAFIYPENRYQVIEELVNFLEEY